MKKILKLSCLVILTLSAVSFSRQAQPLRLEKISDSLYQTIGGSGANGGFYIGDNAVLVIDAKQTKDSVDNVIAEIKKITDKPIKYLANTHADGDHTTGDRFLPQSTIFVAHENCRKEMLLPGRDGKPSSWNSPELLPFLPAVTFSSKMDLYLGTKNVQLWYFGVGHTTGDAVIYFPEEKTAFIGDQIFLTRTPLIHSYKGGNSLEQVKTLTKMLDTLDAQKFCSGHSETTDRKGVQGYIDKMKALQEKVKSLMGQNKTIDEITKEFEPGQSALITSIYNELKAAK